eukprot:TRINITY_DN27876_c0_g1_i2.p1 TRINITY_DN27876_c0_g1~~TRINITY_DN27876_c0_g1_i2.p1  ORF type:complete len:1391 (+),score=85.90 TRINITY_DN27876_c0_g1_i2:129-4301(+)
MSLQFQISARRRSCSLCSGVRRRYDWAHPAAVLLLAAGTAAQPSLAGCSVQADVFRTDTVSWSGQVNGRAVQDSPCPLDSGDHTLYSAGAGVRGQWVFACRHFGAYVCDGDGSSGPNPPTPANCTGIGTLGCPVDSSINRVAVSGVSFSPDQTALYAACRRANAITHCQWDNATLTATACKVISNAECQGADAISVTVPPSDGTQLVVHCNGSPGGVMVCPLSAPGSGTLTGACASSAQGTPCVSAKQQYGLSFDTSGKLLVGCRLLGHRYCSFDPVRGPSACGQTGGQSPCQKAAGVAVLPSGRTGLACFAEGWYVCGPTAAPTLRPSPPPSPLPTLPPSAPPSASPSSAPSEAPKAHSGAPTQGPTRGPTRGPSETLTGRPSAAPTLRPSVSPRQSPTTTPSQSPSAVPSAGPTVARSVSPTRQPMASPSGPPTGTARNPSGNPSIAPTELPIAPTTSPSGRPSIAPTGLPVAPTTSPSVPPTESPAAPPSAAPSSSSVAPTKAPLAPTEVHSTMPSDQVVYSGSSGDAVAAAVGASGGSGGAHQVALVHLNALCQELGSLQNMSRMLHPTQWRIDGDAYLGCVVSAVLISLGVVAANYLAVVVIRWGDVDKDGFIARTDVERSFLRFIPVIRNADGVDIAAVARFPNVTLFTIGLLYQGAAFAALRLTLGADQPVWRRAIGAVVSVACLLYAFWVRWQVYVGVRSTIHPSDPAGAEPYPLSRVRRWELPRPPLLLQYLILSERGDWVSTRRARHWVHSWQALVRPYMPQRAAGAVTSDYICMWALGLVNAPTTTSPTSCGHARLAAAVVLLARLVYTVLACPHRAAREASLEIGRLISLITALLMLAVGFYKRELETGQSEILFSVAIALALASSALQYLQFGLLQARSWRFHIQNVEWSILPEEPAQPTEGSAPASEAGSGADYRELPAYGAVPPSARSGQTTQISHPPTPLRSALRSARPQSHPEPPQAALDTDDAHDKPTPPQTVHSSILPLHPPARSIRSYEPPQFPTLPTISAACKSGRSEHPTDHRGPHPTQERQHKSVSWEHPPSAGGCGAPGQSDAPSHEGSCRLHLDPGAAHQPPQLRGGHGAAVPLRPSVPPIDGASVLHAARTPQQHEGPDRQPEPHVPLLDDCASGPRPRRGVPSLPAPPAPPQHGVSGTLPGPLPTARPTDPQLPDAPPGQHLARPPGRQGASGMLSSQAPSPSFAPDPDPAPHQPPIPPQVPFHAPDDADWPPTPPRPSHTAAPRRGLPPPQQLGPPRPRPGHFSKPTAAAAPAPPLLNLRFPQSATLLRRRQAEIRREVALQIWPLPPKQQKHGAERFAVPLNDHPGSSRIREPADYPGSPRPRPGQDHGRGFSPLPSPRAAPARPSAAAHGIASTSQWTRL